MNTASSWIARIGLIVAAAASIAVASSTERGADSSALTPSDTAPCTVRLTVMDAWGLLIDDAAITATVGSDTTAAVLAEAGHYEAIVHGAAGRTVSFELDRDGLLEAGRFEFPLGPGRVTEIEVLLFEQIVSARLQPDPFDPATAPPGLGPCCVQRDTPGCGDVACEALVCAVFEPCCTIQWAEICVELALTMCADCAAPGCAVDASCQLPDQLGHGMNDLEGAFSDFDSSQFAAENFRAEVGGSITGICWWGFYLDLLVLDVCGPGPDDTFFITYSADDAGQPGDVIGGPFELVPDLGLTGATIAELALFTNIPEYQFTVSHDPVPVDAGTCYWVEIRSNAVGSGCLWVWSAAPPGDGDHVSAAATSDYDLAFCLDVAFEDDGCAGGPVPGTGDCCAANLTPGCEDLECQTLVCAIDAFCCDFPWDTVCALLAQTQCEVCQVPEPGDCCEAARPDVPGCDDPDCEAIVCAIAPSCCDIGWDVACAETALAECETCGGMGGGDPTGDCCTANGTPGCEDVVCHAIVCVSMPECCDVEWDAACAAAAQESCVICPNPGPGDCCVDNGTPGCDDPGCEALVCATDAFCCDSSWDGICAQLANQVCEGVCFAPGPGGCADGEDTITVDITFDGFPEETTWELVDTAGNPIASGGPYPGGAGRSISEEICIPAMTGFVFTIFDSFGDGICCDFGEGGYTISVNGNLVCTGGVFFAEESCEVGGSASGPGEDCCDPAGNGTPGCDDPDCEATVCAIDAICCDVVWDAACASVAAVECAVCDSGGGGGPGSGDCCFDNGTPGCGDPVCEALVCSTDAFCCDTAWDQICADQAELVCGICGGGCGGCGDGDCCDPAGNGTPGCDEPGCESTVCAAEPFCCDTEWDSVCADLASIVCVICGGGDDGHGDDGHGDDGHGDDGHGDDGHGDDGHGDGAGSSKSGLRRGGAGVRAPGASSGSLNP